jgi:hypothetical protein
MGMQDINEIAEIYNIIFTEKLKGIINIAIKKSKSDTLKKRLERITSGKREKIENLTFKNIHDLSECKDNEKFKF